MALTEVDRLKLNEMKGIRQAGLESSRQLKLANKELRQLNETQAEIARSNSEIERLQSQALEENQRQTALLQSQLALSKRSDLERRRQNELKQAAFSVNEKISECENLVSNIAQYIALLDQSNQVQWVGLTADEAHEISDKQYLRDVLSRLAAAISTVKSSLSEPECRDVESFFSLTNSLQENLSIKQRLSDELSSIVVPAEGSSAVKILISKIMELVEGIRNKDLKSIAIALGLFASAGPSLFIVPVLVAIMVIKSEKSALSDRKALAQDQIARISRERSAVDEKIRATEAQIAGLKGQYPGAFGS